MEVVGSSRNSGSRNREVVETEKQQKQKWKQHHFRLIIAICLETSGITQRLRYLASIRKYSSQRPGESYRSFTSKIWIVHEICNAFQSVKIINLLYLQLIICIILLQLVINSFKDIVNHPLPVTRGFSFVVQDLSGTNQ